MPRTSGGDPAKTLALLWRHETGARSRRGPRPRLDVDTVVEAAIELADTSGLDALTIRALADRLGVSAMTVYSYVPGKAELLDLMLDELYVAMRRTPWTPGHDWRARLQRVAEANRELYAAHPWAAHVSTARPPLGPGLMAKYEHELGALDGVGLSDIEIDAALTFALAFVQSAAVAAQDVASAYAESGGDEEWWAVAGPLLARVADPERYPLAARVGAAAGAAQGAAYDPDRAYAFGLERILDGLGVLIVARSGGGG